jgi:2-polyprenyl-3-methyl-5-hydroxy-6-metoxy-1,4-benzoquinol methylase
LSSWKFQPHVQHQIDLIKSLPSLTEKSKIIEIGSNDGMFLEKLSDHGLKNSLGIEPAEDAYRLSVNKGIKTQKIFLNNETSEKIKEEYGTFDLLISRQNIEHISDLQSFANSIKELVNIDGYVLIEVPNFMCNLDNPDYALWEEHVNYFTLDTLMYFLATAGVKVLHKEIIQFSGETIFVIGQYVNSVSIDLKYLKDLRTKNYDYANSWPIFKDNINNFFLNEKIKGKKIAVYGAGSRIFCFLNYTGVWAQIDFIVDDQVEKQGKFMPGAGVPILASDCLYGAEVDICLLGVNTENEDKVISRHANWQLDGGKFLSVLPPSSRLPSVWRMS